MRARGRKRKPCPPVVQMRLLSPEEEAKARELIGGGLSRDMAAQLIGISPRLLASRLEDQLSDLRVGQGRGKKARQPDPTPEEIAALLPRVRPSRLQPLFRASQSVPGLMPLLLPLLPRGMRRSFRRDLAEADRLLVSDAGLAKTLALETTAPVHVYLHTPMRHIWHDAGETEARVPAFVRPAVRRLLGRLRREDRAAAGRVASWAVNSCTTARRAAKAYGLAESSFRVIHPPVQIPAGPPRAAAREGLLVVSGMQPYKNDRLAVEAARLLDLPLTVVGDGPERKALEAINAEAIFAGGHLWVLVNRVSGSVLLRLGRDGEDSGTWTLQGGGTGLCAHRDSLVWYAPNLGNSLCRLYPLSGREERFFSGLVTWVRPAGRYLQLSLRHTATPGLLALAGHRRPVRRPRHRHHRHPQHRLVHAGQPKHVRAHQRAWYCYSQVIHIENICVNP